MIHGNDAKLFSPFRDITTGERGKSPSAGEGHFCLLCRLRPEDADRHRIGKIEHCPRIGGQSPVPSSFQPALLGALAGRALHEPDPPGASSVLCSVTRRGAPLRTLSQAPSTDTRLVTLSAAAQPGRAALPGRLSRERRLGRMDQRPTRRRFRTF